MEYILNCEVTVSAYTKIEADSLEDAISKAKDREVILKCGSSMMVESEAWIIEDADGMPVNIHE